MHTCPETEIENASVHCNSGFRAIQIDSAAHALFHDDWPLANPIAVSFFTNASNAYDCRMREENKTDKIGLNK